MLHARPDGLFRVLQLTDFHHDVPGDGPNHTWQDIHRLVRMYRPDFLAVTGDIWCSDEAPQLGPARMATEIKAIEKLGIPWGFCWGNHDWVDDLERRQAQLAAASNAALMCDGDGHGNFRIEVRHENNPVWDIFFINSEDEWKPDEHLHWFNEECARIKRDRKTLPAIAYFHIPLREYEEARIAGTYQGVAGEEVLCWGDDGSIFEQFRAAGNIRLCFCGHSHRNDFRIEKHGITMVSGRVIGYPGYGELKRGATLLDLDVSTNEFAITTVFADGTSWRHDDAPSAVPHKPTE